MGRYDLSTKYSQEGPRDQIAIPGIRVWKERLLIAEPMTYQTTTCKIAVNSEAAASIHDDGLVILDRRSGRLFTSNQTGARIWRGIERQLSLDAIADEIGSEYQIARITAREHTARFLAELERNNLVERRAGL